MRKCLNFEGLKELLYEEDITSVDICLPMDCNEYISKPFLCTFKLLWYAHVYDKNEVNNLKHVMNEVVTTYEVMLEIYYVYNLLAIREPTQRSQLWLFDEAEMEWHEENKKSRHITRVYESMTSLTGIDAMISIQAMIEEIKDKLREQQQTEGKDEEVFFRREQYSVIQTDENKLKRKWGN